MAVKTQITSGEFRQILSGYELGVYIDTQPISPGTVQTNYLLHTTQGKFVFRYYENRSRESVLFETDLLTYLKKCGYPCPAPFQNNQGSCVSIFKTKPYVIFEFIRGDCIEHPNDEHKEQLIQKVAELQLLTRDYNPRYKDYR